VLLIGSATSLYPSAWPLLGKNKRSLFLADDDRC